MESFLTRIAGVYFDTFLLHLRLPGDKTSGLHTKTSLLNSYLPCLITKYQGDHRRMRLALFNTLYYDLEGAHLAASIYLSLSVISCRTRVIFS